MSTIKTHRAKIIITILLSITLVATVGLVANGPLTNANDDLNSNDSGKLSNNIDDLNIDKLLLNDYNKINYLANFKTIIEEDNDLLSLIKTVEIKENAKLNDYKKVSVVATGYTAGVESTGKSITHPEYGITYSGVQVRRDIYSTIAADLKIFPIGTVLYIPNYGYGVVSDKGSAINGYKIDLFFDTIDEVYEQWGKKRIDVYVVEYGNGKMTEHILDSYNQLAMANL